MAAQLARFVEDLADAVLPVGGWAACGDSHTIYDLASSVGAANEDYSGISDRAIDFV